MSAIESAMRLTGTLIVFSVLSCSFLFAFLTTRPPEIEFQKHTIDLGSSETALICDVDQDGKLDIVSGENWYQAPSWKKHRFRDILYTNNYIDDLSTLALDVDGDGKVDLITSGWFSKRLAWWRNPGASGTWQENTIESGSPIEFTFLVDLTNTGRSRDVLPQFGDSKTPLAWYEFRDGGFVKHAVSDRSHGHGIGVGDVNGDGRNDILTPEGWLEAPSDLQTAGKWTFHADWKLGSVGRMYVTDVNGDGRTDIVTSMAHDYGVFWLERKADGSWAKRLIDESWSQPHAMTMVDFRGNGSLGLLTGKRYMAHNGSDPGEREPLGVYWYERLVIPETQAVEWVKHVIDYGTRTGGGVQIAVADIDRDGDLDFVVGGKSGLFLFENKTK